MSLEIILHRDCKHAEPTATLKVTWDSIDQAHLAVANRTARNRTTLYQKKHGTGAKAAGSATRNRAPELATLNRTIEEHYELLIQENKQRRQAQPEDTSPLEQSPIIAFPISDLTANPLRPHYDTAKPCEQRATKAGDNTNWDGRLFHLEDEPLGHIPYTLLLAYGKDQLRFAVWHKVKVAATGELPAEKPQNNDEKSEKDWQEIRESLRWWAACPPLLNNGEHDLLEYTVLDYDLRHIFGFTEAEVKAQHPIYGEFPDWRQAIEEKLQRHGENLCTRGQHAALGITDTGLVVVHRSTTIPGLARELQKLGAIDAVLLDSGGSCAIWANWANGNQGAVLANHTNFRPRRGAVVFLVLKGPRYPDYK